METKRHFQKRFFMAPAGSALLILAAVAAVNAVKPENMIATDGAIEVIDGKHIQELTRELPFEPGQTVAVISANGKITVEGWDSNEIHITATKQMERRVGGLGWLLSKLSIDFETSESMEDYFDKVQVEVRKSANGIEVETIKPESGPSVNVSVLYDIKVPRNTNLDVKTSNGRVEVNQIEGIVVARSSNGGVVCENITGTTEAHTSNGSVVCVNVSGQIQAHTSNGSITVEHPTALGEADDLTCTTSNGSIRLSLAPESAFDVHAKTSNGRIRSDFAVDTSDGRSTKRELQGFVGQGGANLELKTSNGSIAIGSL